MALIHYPQVGTILRVDLNAGFKPPEMVKRRPAVVVSQKMPDRHQLCTIVPLSTTPPRKIRPYHCQILLDPPLPAPYDRPEMWVKADMIMCVAFHRLHLLQSGKSENGERIYDVRVLDRETLCKIRQCILSVIPDFN